MHYDTLLDVANANKSLVARQRAAMSHEESDRFTRQTMAHYSLFVQIRESMLKENEVTPEQAERATKIAGGPFFKSS